MKLIKCISFENDNLVSVIPYKSANMDDILITASENGIITAIKDYFKEKNNL